MLGFKFTSILWIRNWPMEAEKKHAMYVPSPTSLRGGPFFAFYISVLFLVLWETHHAIESVVVCTAYTSVSLVYLQNLLQSTILTVVSSICHLLFCFSSHLYLQKPPQLMVSVVCLRHICGHMNNTDSGRDVVLTSLFLFSLPVAFPEINKLF